ncbi:Fructose-1,6-bisphosphatase class 2 [bioreactor metagenome]|jgi:fructose-1,6-bisphosphatase II|uniref:Fructose-1,6-bisphosphatase class 2 n=1 Tax=bioreactor metagenome TaxID=1076179 RepID=A0A644VPV9_9ZZZZ|nr:class II fructose-bisphosphatase [Aminivibrio sp.]MDD3514184.1 class II fructose-bisphosphatase [Synergistaceae bacterium]MEA4953007.1 class II fructose-bisphosphatase [Aminivibrio sp.]HPF84165.1 class II fructose-bisphosphatase [Aminivibrio sp.]HRX26568.1 class II fructose-bisphosphatase [Aminivibrio sp.]
MFAADRNLALELVRATEAAAMAAGRWMGRGDKNAVDGAAVNALRYILNTVSMSGVVVIGEGEKDEAPMLYNGEKLGAEKAPEVDIAVDPIDGTRLTALGLTGAISVVAVSERGTMFNPKNIYYMNKLVVGPEAADVIDINLSPEDNVARVAEAKGKALDDITVVILDRPRHEELKTRVRSAGARIKLIPDGDIGGALLTCKDQGGADVLMGIGGSPEAVITACAIKCLGGNMQCKLWPRNDEDIAESRKRGLDLDQVLSINDLVRGDNVFFAATGVTDGDFLKGVRYEGREIHTSSMVMRSRSGTIRFVDSIHKQKKLSELSKVSGIEYSTV